MLWLLFVIGLSGEYRPLGKWSTQVDCIQAATIFVTTMKETIGSEFKYECKRIEK